MNQGKIKTISSKVKNETRVCTLSTIIQHSFEIPSQNSKTEQEEEIKGMPIGKEVVKRSLFADDIILHLKDLKNSTKKLLDKVTAYKINLQKLVVILYANNKQTKKECRKIIPFIIASKKQNT
jgi:hypothetical protein